MKGTPFIDNAIEESGVVDFVANSVGKIRAERFGEELIFPLKQFSK